MQKPPPSCIFCGLRRKMSKEHVIPRWVSKELAKDPRQFPSPVTAYIEREGADTREITSSRVVNIVTRRVCKTCNEGWMERWLETPVRPILSRMLRGERTVLDVQARTYLAAWSTKVAMVARYIRNPTEPVKPEWLEYFYVNHLPPADWHVWTTGYEGVRPVVYRDATATRLLADGSPSQDTGVVMTLVVGYAAFKVLGLAGGAPEFRSADHVARLWPPFSFDPIPWPPPHHMDDTNLQSFVDAFVALTPRAAMPASTTAVSG